MKKTLLAIAVVAASFSANSQVYYNASNATDFIAGSIIEIDGDTNNWNVLDYSLQTTWNLPAELTAMGEVLYSESWNGNDLTPDNMYITPRIDLSAASGNIALTFKATTPDPTSDNFFAENYSVYVFDGILGLAAAVAAPPAFTEVFPAGQTVYSHSVNVSSFAGSDSLMIGFRHHNCTGQWMVTIDDINVSAVTSINENVIEANVYPNPANDVLNITVGNEVIAAVSIISMDGKEVATSTNGTVNVSDLRAGLYIYQVTTATGKVANGNFAKK